MMKSRHRTGKVHDGGDIIWMKSSLSCLVPDQTFSSVERVLRRRHLNVLLLVVAGEKPVKCCVSQLCGTGSQRRECVLEVEKKTTPSALLSLSLEETAESEA